LGAREVVTANSESWKRKRDTEKERERERLSGVYWSSKWGVLELIGNEICFRQVGG
jgi:hypothetical protein